LRDGGGGLNEPLLSDAELRELGLRGAGWGTAVHRSVEIFGPEHLRLGSRVRVDCFSVITAGPGSVTIGDRAHLGVGTCLLGTAGISIGSFVSLSPRVSVFSTSDDFSDGYLAGPTVPFAYRRVDAEQVEIGSFAVVGAGSVVLPGSRIGRGASVGALSLVNGDVREGDIVAGVPARVIGKRNLARLNALDRRLQAELKGS